MTGERAFWLAWSQIPGVGSILIRRLHQHFGTLAAAWEASSVELSAVGGFGQQTAETVVTARSRLNPEQFLDQHQQTNPCFWTPADADYPHLLLEMPDPPMVLYYQGEVEPLENQAIVPMIAIVGTRAPSDYGRRWTRKLSTALAEAGFTVVSGLADGIDTEAHHCCLAAAGRTIAVLGTGVDVIYPWFNRKLAKRIVQQGLLLSEYPAGTQPDRVNFPRRNRIIAGLCRATLVLEAPQKSGALITARLANEYGRDVYALPGSLDNACSKGCLELLNQGAHLILGENELLDLLGTMPQIRSSPQKATASSAAQLSFLPSDPTPTLNPELQRILQTVTLEPVSFDRIVQQSELATGTVLSALSQLELMGLVSQLPGMRYQRG
jgi:DNA processing protein